MQTLLPVLLAAMLAGVVIVYFYQEHLREKKLQLRVQIIDRYFGTTTMTFGFVDEKTAGVRMISHAEDFLEEYDGWLIAQA